MCPTIDHLLYMQYCYSIGLIYTCMSYLSGEFLVARNQKSQYSLDCVMKSSVKPLRIAACCVKWLCSPVMLYSMAATARKVTILRVGLE